MKRSLILTFLVLLLSFGVANAANRIYVETPAQIFSTGPETLTVDIGVENDVTGKGFAFGWKLINNSSQATAEIVAGSGTYVPGSHWDGAWDTEIWSAFFLPDTITLGGATFNPAGGLPPGNDICLQFDIALDNPPFDDPTSEICIDSVTAWPPSNTWVLDDGGNQIRPLYNDDDLPTCFQYYSPPCLDPVFTNAPAGDALIGDHCVGVSFDFDADPVEPGGSITGFAVIDGPGTIDGDGVYTSGAMDCDTSFSVTVEVSNDCPSTAEYTFDVTLSNVGGQYTNCPDEKATTSGADFSFDLGLDNFDCDDVTETASLGTVTDGVITLTAPDVTSGIDTILVTVTADDGCGETWTCEFDLLVSAGAPIEVVIEKTGDDEDGNGQVDMDEFVFQGTYSDVPVTLEASQFLIGGFDFLIGYDASALNFIRATRGDAIDCWEYFNTSNGPFGNCSGACPTGMIRVVAMAEINDGPNHPSGCDGDDGEFNTPANLVNLTFYVTNDRTYECQYVPVYFYWMDCGDNAISNWDGDSLFLEKQVWNINWVDPNNDYYLIDSTGLQEGGVYGTYDYCIFPEQTEPWKPGTYPVIDFFNGGVDIACADDIDDRGDINLNGVDHEVADAVLYTNYFIYGPAVFDINYQGQVAASDVNNDGRVLTVGDLVYLVRVLTGDAIAYEKLSPFASDATVTFNGNTVTMDAQNNIGAALFVFDGEAEVSLAAENMDILYDVVNGQTRALVYSLNTESIPAGVNEVLTVDGNVNLTELEVADYNGNTMNTEVLTKVVPTAYNLAQNYPNPFNPTTEIAMDLPEAANWNISIYNVAGQLVKSFNGYSDAGTVKVQWDANGVASGIYFYKATANDFVATKKMVLMK